MGFLSRIVSAIFRPIVNLFSGGSSNQPNPTLFNPAPAAQTAVATQPVSAAVTTELAPPTPPPPPPTPSAPPPPPPFDPTRALPDAQAIERAAAKEVQERVRRGRASTRGAGPLGVARRLGDSGGPTLLG